ncbi:hypothetical protein N6H14_05270 [Paenibacillus sp. CC-CFT747]|nr:hypothetical protein N6H14_05270 [Paenibacillus sp. CC-CFT747]
MAKSVRDPPGEIRLPRFKLELDRQLKEPLTALGMGMAFDPGKADFTEMAQGSGEFYISQVKHKTYLKVDEKGTEAAAVTSFMMAGSAPAPSTPFTMVVNRPFFLAIEDRQTGAWLFTGSVYHPEEK